MAAKSKAAAPRKRAAAKATAAVAEVNDNAKAEPRKVTWRGLELELPAEPPKTFMWDLMMGDYAGLARSVLRPDQLPDVRDALEQTDDSFEEFMLDLFNMVADEYALGGDAGESSASQDS